MKEFEHCIDCSLKSKCIIYQRNISKDDTSSHYMLLLHFNKNQIIYKNSDLTFGIFTAKSGKIKQTFNDKNGKEVIIQIDKEGDIGGNIISINNPTVESIGPEIISIAIEPVTICFLPLHVAKQKIETDIELLKLIFQKKMQDINQYMHIINNFYFKNVKERVAFTLLNIQDIFETDHHGYVNSLLSREELSSLSCTTIESVIRYISEFKSKRIIETEKSRFKIIDKLKLLKIAKQDVLSKVKNQISLLSISSDLPL